MVQDIKDSRTNKDIVKDTTIDFMCYKSSLSL